MARSAGGSARAAKKRPARSNAGSAKAPARRRRGAEPGWCVYVLRCGDGSLYTGATNDVASRVARHAAGRGARYTRSRLPVTLVYVERAAGHGAALRREAALKRLPRAQKLALLRRCATHRGCLP